MGLSVPSVGRKKGENEHIKTQISQVHCHLWGSWKWSWWYLRHWFRIAAHS